MNYLAHAYLSFGNAEILAGNMISDFVKGKKQYDFPAGIQLGIRLHREIDRLTDEDAATAQAKKIFSAPYRLYAAAITDVVYDYFLANDRAIFSTTKSLKNFTTKTYKLLETEKQWFGERFEFVFQHMKHQDWLYNYQFDNGVRQSLEGLRRRAMYLADTTIAYELFLQNKIVLRQCYTTLLPKLQAMAQQFFLDNFIPLNNQVL